MSAVKQLLEQLKDKNIKLTVHEGNLRLDAPDGAMTLALRAKLKAHKAELIALMENENGRSPSVPPLDRSQAHPASVVQQRLWFLDQLDPGTPVYNITVAYRLRGALNVAAFAAGINHIVARHEALRTSFRAENAQPVQVIASELVLPLPVIDLSHLEEAVQTAAVSDHLTQMVNHRFQLAEAPLMKTVLLKLSSREHVWIWTMHHIVSDAWSMRVFNQELSILYAAHLANEGDTPAPLAMQYLDYADWQHRQLANGELAPSLAYWQDQLAGAPPLLELPTDRIRPFQQQYDGDVVQMPMPMQLKDELMQLSRKQNSTLFMTMLSAFYVLMHRLSGHDDIIIGTPIAGRNRVELEKMIGFFINTLALRLQLEPEMSFETLLQAVRDVTLKAFSHQNVPFERVLELLKLERNLSHTPLFQVMFNMFTLDDAGPQLPHIVSEKIDTEDVHAKFDLTFYVREQAGQLVLRLVYNPALFDRERMVEMLRQYENLLAQISADPNRPIGAYALVTDTAVSLLPDPTLPLSHAWQGAIHEQFSLLAARFPDRFAVIDEKNRWTYEQLEQRSNQLAHHLRANDIERGDVVAVYGHRSASLVWALLGIMKAGAAFMMLDPAYPQARLTQFMEKANPKELIQLAAAGELPVFLEPFVDAPDLCRRVVLPDEKTAAAQPQLHDYPTTPTAVSTAPDDLSHIAFTSGSTGVPKGVLGRHGSLSHFLPWQAEAFGLSHTDRFSMLSGLSHDPLQRDIFTALWVGGTICIPSQETIGTPGQLAAWMAEQQISFAHMTPPMAQLMTETAVGKNSKQAITTIPSLRGVFFVGDKLTREDVRRLQQMAPNATCINSYGATETQRAVSYDLIPPDDANAWRKAVYPLGQGMPDAQLLILNKGSELAGIGEVGEIYMRSPHLALGYLDDAQRTADRFLQNPFTSLCGDRLYRTGDLGRYLPDGRVAFAGRADRQFKIRGFRIEPGEIEAALGKHEAIREAIVMLHSVEGKQPRLAAYLLAALEKRPLLPAIRAFLKQQVPDYMIPSDFVWLDSIPLTPNGKINYRALPQPQLLQPTPGSISAAPVGQIEQKLAQIWAALLDLPAIGRHDNFFESGGHSLLAIRLFAQIEAEFGARLPLTTLFTSPTVAELAAVLQLDEKATAVYNTLIPIQMGSSNRKPPVFLVHGFGGGVVGYGELARLLGSEQTVFGLQAQGMDGLSEPHESIEMMALHYVNTIKEQQPNGPYMLGGYCYGGVVAYEVARQLREAGDEIALLGIFEGYAPLRPEEQGTWWSTPSNLINFLRNIPYWFAEYRQLGSAQMLARIRRKARNKMKAFGKWMGTETAVEIRDILDDESEVPAAHRHVMEAQIRARRHYYPSAYDGPVALFRTKARSLFRAHDPQMGWQKLGKRGVDLRMIDGGHNNILERPYVSSLAVALRDEVQKAIEKP